VRYYFKTVKVPIKPLKVLPPFFFRFLLLFSLPEKSKFLPMNQSLTPAQNKLWNDSRLQELISRFQLEPLPSKEVLFQNKITARIDEWFGQFSDPNHIEPPAVVKYTSPLTGKSYESPF
jgi:hypothetical protein